jgi:signal transduction histidine kinase
VQVFCNLGKNAVEAMGEGGVLKVTTSLVREDVVVRFADTGPGIPTEIRDKVFEPFFSTKRPGEGTGLGLAISRDIVEKYGGSITIEDGAERGVVMVVRIPAKSANVTRP